MARISDNSKNLTIKIFNLPAKGIFAIGNTPITYEVIDEGGNTASCVQQVIVIEKRAEVLFCPGDVEVVIRSNLGREKVTYQAPEFIDLQNESLAYSCFPPSDSEFHVGETLIRCAPKQQHDLNCTFKVVVKKPDCPVPYPDIPPQNGALICGVPDNHMFPRTCRVHCKEGFVLPDLEPDHLYTCGWDGSWNVPSGWPNCRKSRTPSSALTSGEITIAFSGDCMEKKSTIEEAFVKNVEKLLVNHCSPNHICSVRNVSVQCGPGTFTPYMFKRDTRHEIAADRFNDSITFTLEVIRSGVTGRLTKDMLKTLYWAVENLYTGVEENINLVFMDGFDDNVTVGALETIEYTRFDLPCTPGEQLVKGLYWQQCTACSPGTFFNGSQCSKCPIGYYQDTDNQLDCKKCPDGQTTRTQGATDLCQCEDESSVVDMISQTVIRNEPKSEDGWQCYICHGDQTTNVTLTKSCVPQNCGSYCIQGNCSLVGSDPACTCPDGYRGARCEEKISPCEDYVCSNNASCNVTEYGEPFCTCTQAFKGGRCEIAVYPCLSDPCLRGYCVTGDDDQYTCTCDDGWSGEACDMEVNECAQSSCLNGGNCTLMNSVEICQCQPLFTGSYCEYALDPCVQHSCFNNGRCQVTYEDVHCICPYPFTGRHCLEQVDSCLNYSCSNNGTCVNVDGSPQCACPPNYGGHHCEIRGEDFDLVFDTVSQESFVSFRPVFVTLFELSVCLWVRTTDTRMYGTVLSYSAKATDGYSGIDVFTLYDYGRLKVIINGLEVNTHQRLNDACWHHVCITWTAVTGQWSLYINGSVRATGEGLATSQPIAANGYLVIGQRQETVGNGFSSREGFLGEIHQFNWYSRLLSAEEVSGLAAATTCKQDIPGDIVSWSNLAGHEYGQVKRRNGSHCLEFNHCLLKDACADREFCVDLGQSHACIDPCASSPCRRGSTCIGDFGGTFRCVCPPQRTGQTCELHKIYNCSHHGCQHMGECRPDKLSGYNTCQCRPGFQGYACEILQTPCNSNPCQHSGQCMSNGTHYSCGCIDNWQGRNCQTEYRPMCTLSPCLNGGTCQSIPGTKWGYKCLCPETNMGSNCEVDPCLRIPCKNNGSCHSFGENFNCTCSPNFEGHICEFKRTANLSLGACTNVECLNGGNCVFEGGIFQCKCKIQYKGRYCEVKRNYVVNTYHGKVTVVGEYKHSLKFNDSWIAVLTQSIHQVFAEHIGDSMMRVHLNNLSEGSILVDYTIVHTVYTDSIVPGTEAMTNIIKNQVMQGYIGQVPVTMKHFQFELVHSVSSESRSYGANSGSTVVWLSCVIVLLVLCVLAIPIVLYLLYRRKKLLHRHKMNNAPVKFRVRNAANNKPLPSPTIRLPGHNEEIYSEPYAIDSAREIQSDSSSVCTSSEGYPHFPSKHGEDINRTWASVRQNIPLPPRPLDGKGLCKVEVSDDEYLQPMPHRTPPPSYRDVIKKNVKVANANIHPSGCIEMDYLQPVKTHATVATENKDNQEKLESLYLEPIKSERIDSDHESDEDSPAEVKLAENQPLNVGASNQDTSDEEVVFHVYDNQDVSSNQGPRDNEPVRDTNSIQLYDNRTNGITTDSPVDDVTMDQPNEYLLLEH